METYLDEKRLKKLLKDALIEVLEERKEILSEILVEAMEDIGLIHAIREGESTKPVSKEEILKIMGKRS